MTVIFDERKNNREKIWKAVRMKREFSVDEIAALAAVSCDVVSRYVYQLFQAGYVRQGAMRKEADGRKRRLWRLAKNTGPKAPVPCRCIYDPNIDDATVSEPEVKDVA